jgi:hypothetical protein
MAATNTTFRTVAPAVASGLELRWEGSEYHTGVTVTDSTVFRGWVRVTREGKADVVSVDLSRARTEMAPVLATSEDEVVAWLGLPFDGPIQVTRKRDDLDWVEYPNVETALVALAFEHII